MVSKEREGSYVQCLNCGRIHQIEKILPIEVFTVRVKCPRCGSKKGINCGNDIEDIYLYSNENLDPRYYEY